MEKLIKMFQIMTATFLVCSFLTLCSPSLGLCLQFDWSFEIVDYSVSDSNQVSSIALDSNNRPAISYYDLLGDRYLRYVHKASDGTWQYSTVDPTRGSGDYSSLQFNPVTGYPAISYISNLFPTTYPDLKFAQFNGTNWEVSGPLASGPNEVDPYDTSLAFNPITKLPAIAYNAGTSGLGFLEYDGASWGEGTVPLPWRNMNNEGAQLKYKDDGKPAILYGTKTELELAIRDTDWDITVVDNNYPENAAGDHQNIGLEFDIHGNPHIVYMGEGSLKYAFFNGTNWDVNVFGLHCGRADLELDNFGNPFIAYQRGSDIYFGYKDGGDWTFDWFAPEGYSMSNLIIDDFGKAHISFMKWDSDVYADRNLYYAVGTPVAEPVPEPSTLFLLASGLIGLVGFRRKFRGNNQYLTSYSTILFSKSN